MVLAYLPCAGAYERVLILISTPTPAGQEFIRAFRQELGSRHPLPTEVRTIAEVDSAPGKETLVVAVGVQALQHGAQLKGEQGVLGVLIPQPALEKVRSSANVPSLSAVFLDQPPARQMRLLHRLLPDAESIGILLGPDSSRIGGALKQAAEGVGLKPVTATLREENELTPSLKLLLESSGALLAVPDPLVHQPGTAQTLLLTSYRYRKPVIGYSQAYVTAGALAAAYSSPADIARQAAEIAAQTAKQNSLPPPQAPRYFSIAINRQVARSLGIAVPDVPTLTESLIKEEQ